jgi:hypothetical protein
VKYKEGYKFQTVGDTTLFIGITPPKSLLFQWAILSNNGWLTIIHDYAWNGMSGIPLNIKSTMRGVVVHDVTYQMIRLGFLDIAWKDKADQNLRDMCIEDGLPKFMAATIYKAVQKFGLSSTAPKAEPETMEAP